MPAPLIAVEGLDGAGKNTLTTAVTAGLRERGLTVARLAFPRYGRVHADLAAEALHGRLAGVADSAYTMALLFALDRHQALGDLARLRAGHDVVLLDRYVASNAAYTVARCGSAEADEALRWVADLEFDRLGLPVPALQVLLQVPVELAAERASAREAGDPARTRDRYERDGELQSAVAGAYSRLATEAWMSPWRVCGSDPAVSALVDEIGELVRRDR